MDNELLQGMGFWGEYWALHLSSLASTTTTSSFIASWLIQRSKKESKGMIRRRNFFRKNLSLEPPTAHKFCKTQKLLGFVLITECCPGQTLINTRVFIQYRKLNSLTLLYLAELTLLVSFCFFSGLGKQLFVLSVSLPQVCSDFF